MSSADSVQQPLTVNEVLSKAAKSAIRGGTAGALAMGANVGALMWMRTTVSSHSRTHGETVHGSIAVPIDFVNSDVARCIRT